MQALNGIFLQAYGKTVLPTVYPSDAGLRAAPLPGSVGDQASCLLRSDKIRSSA